MFNGKKTYSGLVAALVGLVMVVVERKFNIAGMADYGQMVIVAGLGLAGYGRWAVAAPAPVAKKTRKPRAKKVNGNA